MSASTPAANRGLDDGRTNRPVTADHGRRLSTETKSAFKTTEFMAYLAVLAAIVIAGAVTSASSTSSGAHHADVFTAHQVWLYAAILTVGYMISRGLAKMGSRQPYDERS